MRVLPGTQSNERKKVVFALAIHFLIESVMLRDPLPDGEVPEWKLTVIDFDRLDASRNVMAHEEWLDPIHGAVTFADSADRDGRNCRESWYCAEPGAATAGS